MKRSIAVLLVAAAMPCIAAGKPKLQKLDKPITEKSAGQKRAEAYLKAQREAEEKRQATYTGTDVGMPMNATPEQAELQLKISRSFGPLDYVPAERKGFWAQPIADSDAFHGGWMCNILSAEPIRSGYLVCFQVYPKLYVKGGGGFVTYDHSMREWYQWNVAANKWTLVRTEKKFGQGAKGGMRKKPDFLKK